MAVLRNLKPSEVKQVFYLVNLKKRNIIQITKSIDSIFSKSNDN